MYVSPDGSSDTIGGGQLEYMAIDRARSMLKNGFDKDSMAVPLGPEIGQCCGGFVEISVERMTDADKFAALGDEATKAAAYPTVYVFGAGHVGRALVDCLSLLPVHAVLVDERQEELDLCQTPVRKSHLVFPEQEVRAAPPGSAFVILTHEHATDFLIAAEALARADAAYVGMIGSQTKRVSFERWCKKNVRPPVDTGRLICPIGASASADKRPEVIAALVAAEVIDRLTASTAVKSEPRSRLRHREGHDER